MYIPRTPQQIAEEERQEAACQARDEELDAMLPEDREAAIKADAEALIAKLQSYSVEPGSDSC